MIFYNILIFNSNILNNRDSILKLDNLNEVREYLIKFEESILGHTNNNYLLTTNIKQPNIIVNYDNDIFKIVKDNVRIMCLIYKRLSLSELIADIKFNQSPFIFLNKINDIYKLVTNREIEKNILSRIRLLKLNESDVDLYIKIMELSKRIQVKYLEQYIKERTIGYLGNTGTFSYETVNKNFHGIHKGYDTIKDIYDGTSEVNTVEPLWFISATYELYSELRVYI